jgi:cytochrome oxidase Cu insertion factor (SCO1/SenC/PrrC family)
MVLGWLAYYFHWDTGSAGNYGELISPRALPLPALQGLKGKWVFVTLDRGTCPAACEKKLYVVRQVRRAQGKEMDRVERLWLVTDDAKPSGELLAATEGSQVARADAAAAAQFPGNPADYIYLVDPLGNLMMRWPAEPDPARLIKDVQRLLRYSRFG